MPNYKVKMGFGLHLGKIYINYINCNNNMII